MDKKLLEILVCPLCHSKLTYVSNKNLLLCHFDRLSFPFDDAIPVLLPDRATSLTSAQLKELEADE